MMTQPWSQIVARYEAYKDGEGSIHALGRLARRIGDGPLAQGLFGSPSMFELCINQIPVSYPFDGPLLRISPLSGDRIEFRYVDTHVKSKQWHRSVEAEQAWTRLIKFLDQLKWFPTDVLESLNEKQA
jgi:hypothetical protein